MANVTVGQTIEAQTSQPTDRALLAQKVALVLGIVVLAAGFLWLRLFGGNPTGAIILEYRTEAGMGIAEGVVNSPLIVTVRMPRSRSSGSNFTSSVSLSLLDQAGNPAVFGDRAAQGLPMRPTLDAQTWEYTGSLPSKPGVYHARLEWRATGSEKPFETLDLPERRLVAVVEPGAPLRSGYVLSAAGDLWVLASDGSRERRVTFLSSPSDYADHPSWSPDGKRIAFSYLTGIASNQLPKTSIWVINADGSGARPLIEHGENESLYHPQWSDDGKYLYFTAEDMSLDANGAMQPKRVDRIELATGTRSQTLLAAAMPDPTGLGDEIVYLEELFNPGNPVVQKRISRAEPDRQVRTVLVGENDFFDLYAPRMSPDRKWVVFAAVAQPTGHGDSHDSGFDLLKWLTFEPRTASAHNFPWEFYLAPASGGQAARLTNLNEDQPHPIWLDEHTIAFIGVRGLYNLTIDDEGRPVGEPFKIREGVQHSMVTWHGP